MTITGPAPRRRRISAGGAISYFDASDPCAVYRIKDAEGVVIYIGWSHDPAARVEAHRREQPWKKEIAEWSTTWYPDRAAARNGERSAIYRAEPRYNIAGVEPYRRSAVDAVLAAWAATQDEHVRAQQIRGAMPELAIALDRLARTRERS